MTLLGDGTPPSGTKAPSSSASAPEQEPARLRRAIKRRNAIALYVSSVLGSGVLVLPGLAAQIAGPASLVAWALLAAASIPFGLTFATLSARHPETGGVYAFARSAFGTTAATVTGWLFALWTVVGGPAVALIAASYMGYAFPLDRPETFLLGFAIVASAFAINYRGIVLSNRIQLAIIVSIVALLAVIVAVSGSRVHASDFTPFAPEGVLAIGTAAALIFWSFLGYENVSNVAEEFEDPGRDFPRSVLASVGIVGALYFAVAFVTVGTGAYTSGKGVAPFAAMLGAVFGPYAAAATALMALFIVFGVVNAYTTGMSRVMYATACGGGFPKFLAHLHPETKVPDRALLTLLAGVSVVFAAYYLAEVSLTVALLVASGAAIVVYVIGSAAGWKIFHRPGMGGRRERALAAISLGISLVVLPFLGIELAVTLAVVAAAVLYARAVGTR